MPGPSWLYQTHLYFVLAFVAALFFGVATLGYVLARKSILKVGPAEFLSGSILGLLSFILGFTLSMAVGRFEQRRRLVVDEANAITSAYRGAALLRGSNARAIEGLIKLYLDDRIAYYEHGVFSKRASDSKAHARELQDRIWRKMAAITRVDRGALENGVSNLIRQMFDSETERTFALEKNIPAGINWVILLIGCIALANFGYSCGAQQKSWVTPSILLVVIYSLLFALIIDLDRPQGGIARVSQDAMYVAKDALSR